MIVKACIVLEYNGKEYTVFDEANLEGFDKSTMEYMWTEGNFSCDCNKILFINRQCNEAFDEEIPCGDEIKIKLLMITEHDSP